MAWHGTPPEPPLHSGELTSWSLGKSGQVSFFSLLYLVFNGRASGKTATGREGDGNRIDASGLDERPPPKS